MARRQLQIFVSHSFENGDHDLCQAFIETFRRHHFRVITSERNEPGHFSKKIQGDIISADMTIGIFTRKYKTGTALEADYMPPSYVISECAYALGVYRDTIRTVHGFVEEGIPYDAVGLPTADGQEFPRFNRDEILSGNTTGIEDYVRRLKKYLESERANRQPYVQEYVRKTIEIYRDGSAIFKNKVHVLIRDGESIQRVGGLHHHIWSPNPLVVFPPIEDMMLVPVSPRFDKPFIYAAVLRLNDKDREEPIHIGKARHNGSQIDFLLQFPFDLKSNDRIEYQYVWGMPHVYLTSQRALNAAQLEYQEATIKANHGPIKNVELRLKFERANTHGHLTTIFSKSPYVVTTFSTGDDAIPYNPPITPKPTTDSIYLTYEYAGERIDGAVRMRWIPADL